MVFALLTEQFGTGMPPASWDKIPAYTCSSGSFEMSDSGSLDLSQVDFLSAQNFTNSLINVHPIQT